MAAAFVADVRSRRGPGWWLVYFLIARKGRALFRDLIRHELPVRTE